MDSESDKRRKREIRRRKALEARAGRWKFVTLFWEEGGRTHTTLGFCDELEAGQRCSLYGQAVYETAVQRTLDEDE